ncbi:helix-turn-helix transcriptional regulator [Thalassotalea sp. G2M2-11]|uniref:helix-turn-helix domain-containing protein n=1 Tax=Thalassotalea sp. G2M2-11 TaxID=2787627 RepID=UPI0019D0E120|nr:helix-turn-helix transcriptional regulator [Thalassotalea sp. G2M2-11]
MFVRSLRQKRNWSQQQLAQLSGLNIRTIQRVEKGENVGLETLKSLAAVFEVDVGMLKTESINGNELNTTQNNKDTMIDLEKREQMARAEVKSKKGFYILVSFLLGIFLFFFVPNYNHGENLGALISIAICFAMIIGAYAITVFQPFGEKWEKRKIKQTMDSYEEEGKL